MSSILGLMTLVILVVQVEVAIIGWVRQKLLWNWHFWEFSCLEVIFWVCGFRFYFDFDCFGGNCRFGCFWFTDLW